MAAELATIESLTQRVQSRTAFRDHPALILNADYRPLSYFPLSIWPWQDAIKAVFLDRVNIVSEYETEVHSPTHTMRLPSVVSLREYVQPARYPAFTRFNLFLRDEFTCQYCGVQGDLTFDHVIPRSKGGRTTWDNVVAACSSCNLRKANYSLSKCNMNLRRKAFRPSAMQLQNIGRKFPPNHLHGSWLDYLYWDTELED